ncbi:hypothetical protein KEM60_01411 [Austwickia sp. TVS 96-490-7B]|uniref:hypothetical protein n=1 Tax=Austwickia sp. TVS 96-490-7B TaxID=2830843 RepID=UPI001C599811|nr:hypothetical protein [Austwickia sp. TVS 96-490-7B]MBW3085214.1 hypothetical protein [Austwickia sp. TVS 96-490-7B]
MPTPSGPAPSWPGPDAPAGTAAPTPAVPVSTTFPCVACGAHLAFQPGAHSLRCPYCGADQPVPDDGSDDSIDEHDYEAWLRSADKPRGLTGPHVVSCPRCAATTTTTDISLPCPFCSAPIVVAVDPGEQIVPEGVVPFGIDKSAANTSIRQWTGSRWFAPNDLKKVGTAERLNGTYVPHWTYDAATTSQYSGMRGIYYYVTETYTDSDGRTQTRQVRHTQWWPVSGTVYRGFDDVLVIGSNRLAPDDVERLTPWVLDSAVPFKQGFLAGYQTLRYDVEPEQGLEVAKERMQSVIHNDCLADIGGDEQQVLSVNTAYSQVTFKLMLLPVWVAGYLYRGKTYTVYVNAHTGSVVGERPYSIPKIVAAVLAALLVLGVIVGVYLSQQKKSPRPSKSSINRSQVMDVPADMLHRMAFAP